MSDRKYFQTLESELRGTVTFPKDFYVKVSNKCVRSLTSGTVLSSNIFSTTYTTTSPQYFSDVVIILSVRIIEPLQVSISSISDGSIKLSVEHLSSKDDTNPTIQCVVNGLNIATFPYFNVSKLKKSIGRKDISTYMKEDNQIRTMIMTMNCWADLYNDPITCNARFSGYSYGSNAISLNKPKNLTRCDQSSQLSVSRQGKGSRITKLEWECRQIAPFYTVFVNETGSEIIMHGMCPLRLILGNTTSCSLETDQLKTGVTYKVWVISSDNSLVVDTKKVLITIKSQNDRINIFLLAFAGLGILILSTVGIWRLLLRIQKWKIENWNIDVTQSLNRENLDTYDTNDIVILHITDSEIM